MTTERRHRLSVPSIIFFGLIITVVASVFILLNQGQDNHENQLYLVSDDGTQRNLDGSGEIITSPAQELPPKLDLQEMAEEWSNSVTGTTSVYIYDLDYNEVIASVNAEQNYNTASLYKLFPVYEGYRRVASGEWSLDYNLGSRTIGECLDAAIRSSDSICGEALWNKIGHEQLDEIIEQDYGITNSDISGLSSNPIDIAKILQRFYEHPDFDDQTYLKILDSMLKQPPSAGNCSGGICDWRQGFPAGFEGTGISVFDKVGWAHSGTSYWLYYHDAAIVDDGEHQLIVVVMTANIRSYDSLTKFGTSLAKILQST